MINKTKNHACGIDYETRSNISRICNKISLFNKVKDDASRDRDNHPWNPAFALVSN